MSFKDKALPLIELGFSVAPAKKHMKFPCIKNWATTCSKDQKQIEYWDTVHKWGNPIVVTGEPSGICIIDVDIKDDVDGRKALEEHRDAGRILPPTPMARSASGGLHLYFKHQPGLRNAAGITKSGRGLGVGVDFRGAGGCICGPGSTTAQGSYAWIGEAPTSPESFPKLPTWAIKALRPKVVTTVDAKPDLVGNFKGVLREVSRAGKGRRNDTIFWAAKTMQREGAKPDDYATLMHVCQALSTSDEDPNEFLQHCRATIQRVAGSNFLFQV